MSPPPAPPPLQPLLYAMQDSLMLLAPPGWKKVGLRFVEHGGLFRLAETEVQGDGSAEPPAPPDLGVDPKEEALRLSQGLTELVGRLGERGKVWTPGTAEVSRRDGFCEWRLLRADGSIAWLGRLEPKELELLLMSDDLFRALRGTERAFALLQGSLEQRLGRVSGFSFSSAARQLTVEREGGPPLALPAELIGRYSTTDYTWTWGWALEGAPSDAVRRICAPEAQAPGLAAFWRDFFHADEALVFALAGHVAVATGARGVFRGEVPGADGEVLLFAVSEPGN